MSYDGEFFRIDTIYGPLTLDGEGVACEGLGCPDLAQYISEVTLSGTRRMADTLMPALIQGFATRRGLRVLREVESDTRSTFVLSDQERVRARFHLRGTSTSEGFADLVAEEADMVLAIREPRQREIDMSIAAGAGNLSVGKRAQVLAVDGIVAVKSVANSVERLSLSDVAKILSGTATSWADFGGLDEPIALHLPPRSSGLSEIIFDRVLKPRELNWANRAVIHAFPESLADSVAIEPNAIGLTTLSDVGNTEAIKLLGSCGYEQSPSAAALKTEDYPLTVPLMVYTPARRLPLMAREFLEFVSAPAGDLIIRRLRFVDQSISQTPVNEQGNRLVQAILNIQNDADVGELQEILNELSGRQRLSTTFRFSGGATRLDVQSQENIARLAQALEAGQFEGRDLLFVGFSDATGSANVNLNLSKRRASLVQSLVREAAIAANFSRVRLTSTGYGEALPLACDDTTSGNAANRRVEVWVK